MHWYWKALIGYGCLVISLFFFLIVKLILDFRPLHKRIDPEPKGFYLVHSDSFKGIAQYQRENEGFKNRCVFRNPSIGEEHPHEGFFKQKDIIREADRGEIKGFLIDDL